MAEKQKKIYLDVNRLIEIYNEKNPDGKIDREQLAKKVGVSYQTLTNYNGGLVPNGLTVINRLLDFAGAKYEEVIKEK
jgi:DNA-binding XRE family transcriptional regulator